MTSDFSEAGEQAEGFLAMYEFSRLEDKAVQAAATGRAGRAGITSAPSLRARTTTVRGVGRGPAPSLRPRRPRASPAAPEPPAPASPHHHSPGEVGKYLNPLPETGDYATNSKLNFTEQFCPATSVGVKWRLSLHRPRNFVRGCGSVPGLRQPGPVQCPLPAGQGFLREKTCPRQRNTCKWLGWLLFIEAFGECNPGC